MKSLQQYVARAKVAKALAHASRLFILDLLQQGELSAGELTDKVGADQSTVSKHLAILREVGLVNYRKDGTTSYYRLCCPCIDGFFSCLETVVRADVCTRRMGLK
ncbi:MAG: metalloregulator ArsR/SmtB family transcription factor [Planctomycetaceae bacterium]|nr:metalloregulator ArsR/SmtB family transcription factor [Planctomycetaceae bacterium]